MSLDWDLAGGVGVAFKVPLSGLATSSPIGDNDSDDDRTGGRIYLTNAVPMETSEDGDDDADGFRTGSYGDVAPVKDGRRWRYEVITIDANDGSIIWTRSLATTVPKIARHPKSSFANCTPATDGDIIVAWFGGEGLYALDRDGGVIWQRDLGSLDSGWFYDRSYQWGFGSSPVIAGERVYLQCDVQDQSRMLALDLKTGETIWRTERDEIPTWGTPVVVPGEDDRSDVVIVSGTNRSAAYRCDDGSPLWSIDGFSEIMVPTPQVTPEQILLCSGYRPVQPILSLSHQARGELSLPEAERVGEAASAPRSGDVAAADQPIRWFRDRGGPYMPTPVIDRGLVYLLSNSGILTVLGLDTGRQVYKKRLSGGGRAYCASPIVAGDQLICISESGVLTRIRTGVEYDQIDQHRLGEAVLASPAIIGGRLVVRTDKHLWAFGE